MPDRKSAAAKAADMKMEISDAVRGAVQAHLERLAHGCRFDHEFLSNLGVANADIAELLEDIAERLDLGPDAFRDDLKIALDAEPIDTVGQLKDRVFQAITNGVAS